jgi:hypothetical protein
MEAGLTAGFEATTDKPRFISFRSRLPNDSGNIEKIPGQRSTQPGWTHRAHE